MVEAIKIANQHLINLLTKQGMDTRFVALKHDYAPRSRGKEYTPYARFWEDTKSRKRIMEAGILPHVTNAGFFIVPQFRQVDNKFVAEENCFDAEINSGTARVVCVNDQPNGRKKGDWAEWHPQVFLDGIEQHCGNPLYLDTDPINANYHFNTIEWDFGFCKRRARTIPGRFRDRIFITSDPGWEVEVHNNTTGNMRLKFGSRDADGMPIGRVIGDVEIISKEELAKAIYPVTIGASPETFYPDPHDEVSSVDGHAYHYIAASGTWDAVHDGVGTHADDSGLSLNIQLECDTTDPFWEFIVRGLIVFPTSGLPDICTITGVVNSYYGSSKDDAIGCLPDINVYSSAPASNIAIVAGDYNSLGTEALSSAIAYNDYSVVAYNDFTLIDVNTDGFATNADGTYINKTGVTKLGLRNANYDVADIAPDWADNVKSFIASKSADTGNTTNDPKLVVTYTVGGVTHEGAATLSGVGSISWIARMIFGGSGTLAGTGTLAAIGRRLKTGIATLAGTGALSAVGRRLKTGFATFAGTGTLSALARRIRTGAISLSGMGTLTARGSLIYRCKVTLSGVGTLVVSGYTGVIEWGVATLSGVGSLAVSGLKILTGSSTLSGTGTLSALGKRIRTVTATLSGVGTLATKGKMIFGGRILLAIEGMMGTGSLVIKAVSGAIKFGKVVLSGLGWLSIIAHTINHRYFVRPPDSTDTAVTKTGRYGKRE